MRSSQRSPPATLGAGPKRCTCTWREPRVVFLVSSANPELQSRLPSRGPQQQSKLLKTPVRSRQRFRTALNSARNLRERQSSQRVRNPPPHLTAAGVGSLQWINKSQGNHKMARLATGMHPLTAQPDSSPPLYAHDLANHALAPPPNASIGELLWSITLLATLSRAAFLSSSDSPLNISESKQHPS